MRPLGAFGILALAAGVSSIAGLMILSPPGALVTIALKLSGVGIPIANLFAVTPALALLLVLATVCVFPFRRAGWLAVLIAFLPAAAIMYFTPLLLNRIADAKAFRLVAGDIDRISSAFDGRSLAIFVDPKFGSDCLDFCHGR